MADVKDALEGLQGVRAGAEVGQDGATSSPAPRELAARLRQNPELRDIGRLAGRFKRVLASKRRQRVRQGADEVVSVERGGELERLLPSELVRLGRPMLRLALMRDLLERQCLQYELAGSEARGEGPIIVCLDKSDSMAGQRNTFAVAAALALFDLARSERRAFGVVSFDSRVRHEVLAGPGDALPEEVPAAHQGRPFCLLGLTLRAVGACPATPREDWREWSRGLRCQRRGHRPEKAPLVSGRGEQSNTQWRDILGVLTISGASLDLQYLQVWSNRLGVGDLLTKALEERPPTP